MMRQEFTKKGTRSRYADAFLLGRISGYAALHVLSFQVIERDMVALAEITQGCQVTLEKGLVFVFIVGNGTEAFDDDSDLTCFFVEKLCEGAFFAAEGDALDLILADDMRLPAALTFEEQH